MPRRIIDFTGAPRPAAPSRIRVTDPQLAQSAGRGKLGLPRAYNEGTAAPTVNDDARLGYTRGSHWVDKTASKVYVCTDATPGAAVWHEIWQGATALLHAALTDVSADQHHAQSHTHASHTSIGANDHHNQLHQAAHQSGGGDAQAGNLDANARVAVRKNTGANVGTRRRLNLIEGTNVTLTVADDSVDEEVDVTIAASGGGGGGHTIQEEGVSLTARTNLNARAGILASDNAGANASDLYSVLGVVSKTIDGSGLIVQDLAAIVHTISATGTLQGITGTSPLNASGFLVITPEANVTVTVNHFAAVATGKKIVLNEGRDIVLKNDGTSADTLTLFRQSSASNWYEWGRDIRARTRTIVLHAASGTPTLTSGAATPVQVEIGGAGNYWFLDFSDSNSKLYAEWDYVMPDSWDGGIITAEFHWTANSISTNSVVWGIAAVALADGDLLSTAVGTAVEVTDANVATVYTDRISATSAAITVAGSPAGGRTVRFRVYRDSANASDTLAATARLMAVKIKFTTNKQWD